MSIKEKLRNNKSVFRSYRSVADSINSFISDEVFVRRQFEKVTGKKLDLDNPKTFSEKIQWLKLNWRKPVYTVCADKYEVRQYVQEKLGSSDALVGLYGVYNRPEEIDLNKLPESFVLKVTHGSGQNILCKNKEEIDWKAEYSELNYYLSKNLYPAGREWAYKDIKPRIICEEYLEENGQPPKDYKFFCFNGKPKFVQVDIGRFNNHARNMYDLDWNLLDFELHKKRTLDEVEKPAQFSKMIDYAARLSEEFPFVRVDLYFVNDRIYFGEMTFYPGNGMEKFFPESYDLLIGNDLNLPK